jgi:hypothetical protein
MQVFNILNVQYVMVIQNPFLKFLWCDHFIEYIILLSHFYILFIYFLFHGQ